MREPVKEDIRAEERDKYYFAEARCKNCFENIERYIQKGTPRKGVVVPCDNCGCGVDLSGAP